METIYKKERVKELNLLRNSNNFVLKLFECFERLFPNDEITIERKPFPNRPDYVFRVGNYFSDVSREIDTLNNIDADDAVVKIMVKDVIYRHTMCFLRFDR